MFGCLFQTSLLVLKKHGKVMLRGIFLAGNMDLICMAMQVNIVFVSHCKFVAVG